jgi:hypothetical protein
LAYPLFLCAGLAHLVEQLICNHQVAGSSPAAGTILDVFCAQHNLETHRKTKKTWKRAFEIA